MTVQKKDSTMGLGSTIGGLVGSYYGGPAGGAVGSQLGGAAGGGGDSSAFKAAQPNSSSPASRYKENLQKDPTFQLQQGKAALNGMDPDTQAKLQPVLDEALKKSIEQQKRGSASYGQEMA